MTQALLGVGALTPHAYPQEGRVNLEPLPKPYHFLMTSASTATTFSLLEDEQNTSVSCR